MWVGVGVGVGAGGVGVGNKLSVGTESPPRSGDEGADTDALWSGVASVKLDNISSPPEGDTESSPEIF